MQLIETLNEPRRGLRAEIYQMPASGFVVFVSEDGAQDQREGFVFDTEADARTFAGRCVSGERRVSGERPAD